MQQDVFKPFQVAQCPHTRQRGVWLYLQSLACRFGLHKVAYLQSLACHFGLRKVALSLALPLHLYSHP